MRPSGIDLPSCSAVPQPTALPRALKTEDVLLIIMIIMPGVADKIYVIRSPCHIAILRSSEFFTHTLVYLCSSVFPFFTTCIVKKNELLALTFLFSSHTFRHRFLFRNLTCVCCSSDITFSLSSKAIPLQAWRGPEGSRRLRLPDLKTIGS